MHSHAACGPTRANNPHHEHCRSGQNQGEESGCNALAPIILVYNCALTQKSEQKIGLLRMRAAAMVEESHRERGGRVREPEYGRQTKPAFLTRSAHIPDWGYVEFKCQVVTTPRAYATYYCNGVSSDLRFLYGFRYGERGSRDSSSIHPPQRGQGCQSHASGRHEQRPGTSQ